MPNRITGKLIPKDNKYVRFYADFWPDKPIGGGTSDYEDLENKPSINGVELDGNKTTEDLGINATLVEITYQELKTLRDNNELTPGTWYRITDYTCTTSQDNTQSANHSFDIIVRADDERHLNENAFAAHHKDDEYFVNCKLEAWELKYCLDNDTQRFAWADGTAQMELTIPVVSPGSHDEPLNTVAILVWQDIRWKWKLAYNDSFVYTEPNPTTESKLYASDTGSMMMAGTITSITYFGKGVIYYMKDEWNNECSYDFKNIMFQRWAIEEYQDCSSLEVENENNPYSYYYGAKLLNGSNVLDHAAYGEDSDYFYTFALKDLASDEWYDYTVVAHLGLKNDEDNEMVCYNNHLAEATDEYSSDNGMMSKMLNNIVFFNCYTDLSNTSSADDYSYCNNNRFLGNCHSCTFGYSCCNNSFQNECCGNSFGNRCCNNSFMDYCMSNSFGYGCYSNSFGQYCQSNSFNDNFRYNSFGNSCFKNLFGNDCGGNSFGCEIDLNLFGNNFQNNTFGNNNSHNTFENNCKNNTFGNYCQNNQFGDYCEKITVFDGVQYCNVTGGNQNAPIINVQIFNGMAGASAQNKLTITFAANRNYTQIAAKTTNGTLQIFNPADLVQ